MIPWETRTWHWHCCPGAATPKFAVGEVSETLRLAERIIDLADGDHRKGASVIESPLAFALMIRALARMCFGSNEWKNDLFDAITMVAEFLPVGQPDMMFFKYGFAVASGAVRIDTADLCETAEILELANQQGDDVQVSVGTLPPRLRPRAASRTGQGPWISLLADTREAVVQQRAIAIFLPLIDLEFAKEEARQGNIDGAVATLRSILERELVSGGFGAFGSATEVLVEVLLQRSGAADIAAAGEAIDRLAAVPVEPGVVVYAVSLLRLRALLARACGDDAGYLDYRARYLAAATQAGYEGHIAKAEAM